MMGLAFHKQLLKNDEQMIPYFQNI